MRRATAIGRHTRRQSIVGVNALDKRYLERVIGNDLSFAQRMTRHLHALEPRLLVLQARRGQQLSPENRLIKL